MGFIADKLKKRGVPVFGGSSFLDRLETDRDFGIDVMGACGIETPSTVSFTDFNEAKTFLKTRKKDRYVFKPSGELPCKLTYVPKDPEDLFLYLEFVEEHFKDQIEKFDLQEFLEGIAVSTEFWIDGKRFIRPANHTLELKRFMNDDLGPSTGCSGNVVWPDFSDHCRIVESGIELAESHFVNEGITGQIDLNVLVNEKGVFGLEWTPRFGYDATPTLLELIPEVGKVVSDIARGQFKGDLPLAPMYASGIRVTIPIYPSEPEEDLEKAYPNVGVPISGFEEFKDHCYFYEVMKSGDRLVHSGGTGVIACVTGTGITADQSFVDPEKYAEKIRVPDKQYRTDVRKVLTQMCEDLGDLT
jgi:phosphoribosylamine--glycine ligase